MPRNFHDVTSHGLRNAWIDIEVVDGMTVHFCPRHPITHVSGSRQPHAGSLARNSKRFPDLGRQLPDQAAEPHAHDDVGGHFPLLGAQQFDYRRHVEPVHGFSHSNFPIRVDLG
ncbi:hypothetical protein BLA24064_01234 [Burkholderia latens]|uniref:Uncharacterized protein n=1 Tax=Burkholderia latens TaxID=488446 RepID=A0A6P2IIY4_9BURK|nr:hypothetical protein BLA24064_01234 [Burkholderia latens]